MMEIVLILIIQLIYVPLYTLRIMFVVKNMKMLAAVFGFSESLVKLFALSLVFNGDTGIVGMFVYAVGYGLGTLIGIEIENKLAIGYNNFIVNLLEKDTGIVDELREKGFGVTAYRGEGRDGSRYSLDIMTKRNREGELIKLIENYEPKAFILSYEVKHFRGGFLMKSIRKIRGRL